MIQGAFRARGPRPGDRRRGRAWAASPRRSARSSAAGSCSTPRWRWIFLINLPLAVVTVVVARRWVPETRDPDAPGRFDVAGAALGALALGGDDVRADRVGRPASRRGPPWSAALAAVGVRRGRARAATHPMLPLGLFADRTFTAANAMTLLVYAALGAVLFFLVLQLQTVGGYGAARGRARDAAASPSACCCLAARGGRAGRADRPADPDDGRPAGDGRRHAAAAAGRPGRRLPDRRAARADASSALGLALMVAPLTATVLAAAPDEHAGIASGVNNAVARAGSLLAVAALPVAVGLERRRLRRPGRLRRGVPLRDARLRGAAGRRRARGGDHHAHPAVVMRLTDLRWPRTGEDMG